MKMAVPVCIRFKAFLELVFKVVTSLIDDTMNEVCKKIDFE
jgi:hypothetical protein